MSTVRAPAPVPQPCSLEARPVLAVRGDLEVAEDAVGRGVVLKASGTRRRGSKDRDGGPEGQQKSLEITCTWDESHDMQATAPL